MADSSEHSEMIDSWRKIQEDLRTQVIPQDTEPWQSNFLKLKYVAGLDISTPKESHSQTPCTAFIAIAIYSFPSLEIVHEEVQQIVVNTPYVPGFLAFREAPAACQLVDKILREKPALKPDVILIDGNGVLHPQRCGLACHIGLSTHIPTVGVAKNLFHIEGLAIPEAKELQGLVKTGDFIYLKSKDEILGMALKTSPDCKNPVFVSIGHRISLDTGRRVVLAVSKYRIPEPTRRADRISREAIRKLGEGPK